MKTVRHEEIYGFTLIEVIVTLTIAAIVGSMLYAFMGSSVTKSSLPISRLQVSFTLQQIMENIPADYPKNSSFDLVGLQAAIGGEGTSQNNSYGQCPGSLCTPYTVVENHFIRFDSNQEQSGSPTDNLLKVTIRNSNSETLTKIFVQ